MKIGDRAREGRELKGRIAWAGVIAAALLLLLAGRLWLLQIRRGEEYAARSEGNFVKELRVPADRGMILDRKGQILVDSRPSYDLYLTPAFCHPCEEVLGRLAGRVEMSPEELARALLATTRSKGLERFRQVVVKVDITRDELDVLEASRDDFPGLDVLAAPHRNYRYGKFAAHTLGYLGEASPEELEKLREEGKPYRLGDYLGKRGVERKFEEVLRGEDGTQRVVTDAKGRQLAHLQWMIAEPERHVAARPGLNLVLSLDERLQRTAEEAFDGTAGSVVVVDVNSGFIRALVSKPGFDPNVMTGRISKAELKLLSEDPLEPMVFRPTQDHEHPGSTFKVVTQLAALEHGFGGTVSCGGGYSLGKRRWRCWSDGGHGPVDPLAAMQHSCDTWFYAAADRMGIDAIAAVGRQLGLGRPTGLDLGFEVPGVMPSTEFHDRYTPGGYTKGLALNTSIGQGDTNVTPLQLAMVYATIANGGTVYRPQVVQRVERATGEVVESFEPQITSRLEVSREHLDIVRRGLEMVVNEPGGTAYSKRLKDIRVAGKTGTAQVVRLGAVRLKVAQMDYFERDHAWFAAYAPAEEPQIAVVVLNEHAGHGGAVAAPIAMKVISRYFELLRLDAGPTVNAPVETPAPLRSVPPRAAPGIELPPGSAPGQVTG